MNEPAEQYPDDAHDDGGNHAVDDLHLRVAAQRCRWRVRIMVVYGHRRRLDRRGHFGGGAGVRGGRRLLLGSPVHLQAAASDCSSSSLLMPVNCALANCAPVSLLAAAGERNTKQNQKRVGKTKPHEPVDCLLLEALAGGSLAEAGDAAAAAPAAGWLLSSGHSNTQRSFESISFSGYFFHRSSRLISSSSGFTIDCTMNLCLFFSFESNMNG
uniref:Uncharacterized protein n=1 Tax=Anopheles dirus TaxID=7168 RepID=A0A182N142_9DIPT